MNPISDTMREHAAAHRASFAERPDDPRHARGAEALEALADYADACAERNVFAMRYLLGYHVVDGRFAWPDGQSGRAIKGFGFDVPVNSEWDLELFLMELCDLAKSDATRHIGSNEGAFDRADAPAIGARFGIGADRVHHALDTGRRLSRLWIVGVPDWHEIDPAARAQLDALDGVIVAPGPAKDYDGAAPLLVKNVPANDEADARERIAAIVGIEPGALGVASSARVLPRV